MKKLITLIALLLFSINAYALDRKAFENISVSYGHSTEDIQMYGISTKHDLEFEKAAFYLPQYLEGTVGYWRGDDNSDLYSVSVVPVFQKKFEKFYLEAGVGGAYISKREIQDQELGINFQFVSLAGIGFEHDNYSFSYRIMHYSNLYHKKNDGVDYHVFSIGYNF